MAQSYTTVFASLEKLCVSVCVCSCVHVTGFLLINLYHFSVKALWNLLFQCSEFFPTSSVLGWNFLQELSCCQNDGRRSYLFLTSYYKNSKTFWIRNMPFVGAGYLQGYSVWNYCKLVKAKVADGISLFFSGWFLKC